MRWVARRKEEVARAILSGQITMATACRDYGLSEDEAITWIESFKAGGRRALKIKSIQAGRS